MNSKLRDILDRYFEARITEPEEKLLYTRQAEKAIIALIADRERLLLDRVEKHFEADGQASHAYVREYLATLRKEQSGKEQTDE